MKKPGPTMEILNTQLTLDLPQRAALDAGNFFVSPSNSLAVGWIDRWPDWPSHALLINGPMASGKTHLTHVWQHKSRAPRLPYARLSDAEDLWVAADNLVIEDIDGQMTNPACEEALLHAFNWTRERGGFLLMTARTAPSQWQPHLADLSSRLRSIHLAEIAPPDDSLLAALMVKLFDDRQLRISSDVLLYLLSRTDRSFAAITRLVEALDQASLTRQQKITVPLARNVLQSLGWS